MLHEAEAQRFPPTLSREASAPPRRAKLPADFDLVLVWPVGDLVEPDLADPGARCLVDSCPGTEATLAPLRQRLLQHAFDALAAEGSPAADVAHHVGIAVQPDEVVEI